ncbi:hypothetical protein DFH08DRAFT_918786 [Mycena albidolilacea]|uniref:Integrase core domain-containing protein n=1 Tax=Mycena albidolilacea TaxID=1033008 RepID=A0AAD6Z1P4_9AGAR|nr:hypothetical protein DFH08DRAFT_918786 [Mycena albidolilacea]
MDVSQLGSFAHGVLLAAFRTHFERFKTGVNDIVGSHANAIVISRLGDDIDEFAAIVDENEAVFAPDEFATIQTSLTAMRLDIRLEYQDARSTASISRFLRVGRTTVRNALLKHGIAQPQESPFQQVDPPSPPASTEDTDPNDDDILDPDLPIPSAGEFPPEVQNMVPSSQPTTSFTGPVSEISDDELDMLLLRLRTHYRRAGLSMLNGMLRRLGHRVPTERVRQSLLRIDPVRRIFERIRIRRREYRVLGPNSLWHHDGQHGESVHNVRIERLWVDVTAQVGATWADHFTCLELRYGLDINNIAHIWLLHFLFLGTINSQLAFFAESWNQHRIQIRNSPNRSPTDMFVFDMFVNGVHGDQLPPEEENLIDEELEVYGIDWQGLRDDGVLQSQARNNPRSEGSSSWVGHTGPPPDLSEVIVQPPQGTLTADEIAHFAEDADIISLWNHALTHVRVLYPNVF